MTRLREWIARLRDTFRPGRSDSDLEEELRLHLEMAAEDAKRAGEPSTVAARSAAVRFGGTAQAMEALRDQRGLTWLADLGRDVRYSLRGLARYRSFSVVAILSLAFGIGANTAIFSLINALMLRPLPVRAPAELVELLSHYPGDPRINVWGWKYYEHVRAANHVFADVIGLSPARLEVRLEGGDPETVNVAYVTDTFFSTLGLEAPIGRLIGSQDTRPGPEVGVAVVSASFWRTRFNADSAVLGRSLLVNGVPIAVVGVTPPAFSGLQVWLPTDVWMPVAAASLVQPVRNVGTLPGGIQTPLEFALVGRLKPGTSIEQARAEMRVLDQARIRDLAARDPRWNEAVLDVEPAGAGLSILRDVYAQPLMILMAIVALLLLLACTNIASLLLARGTARRREMAVRVALGAGRWRIVRQGLTEALLLSSFGTLLGIFVAYWGVQAPLAVLQSGLVGALLMRVALQVSVEPDGRVLFFTAGVALLTGVFFGLAPIVDTMASSPGASLSEARMAGETRSRRVFGKSLVVAQVAFSLVLLSAAGLFIRHVSNLRNVDLGFERDSVLLVTLDPRGSGYGRAALSSRYRDLLGHLEAIPGVHSATIAGATPMGGPAAAAFVEVAGFQERPDERRRSMLNLLNWVGPRYFETFGTPILAGREFQFEDAERPAVAIVNRAMARHYFADRDPIGQHVTVEHVGTYEIVGIVADAKYTTLREPAPRTVYLNAFQQGQIVSQFALRTDVSPATVVPDVRRLVRETLNAVSIANVTTLREQVDRSIATERVLAWLSGWFGAIGALLAAIGLYGLLAYTMARRRHEIGVRMSLGATPGNILRMVVKGAAGLVAVGLALGIPVAAWSQRVAANVLGDLPTGSFPVGLASGALIIVALLAAWLPARRASRIRPVEALRHE